MWGRSLLSRLKTPIEDLESELTFVRQNMDKSKRDVVSDLASVKAAGGKDDLVYYFKKCPQSPRNGSQNVDDVSDQIYNKDESMQKQTQK